MNMYIHECVYTNVIYSVRHWKGAFLQDFEMQVYIPLTLTVTMYSRIAKCGASADAAHSNIFSQKIPKYHFVDVCDETYQRVHGHYNLHGESGVYFKIMRKMLFSLKPKDPFP